MIGKRLLLKATLAFSASFMGTAVHAEWLEATTKHFVVVGDTTEGELRKRALRLEQFDAAMRFLLGGEEGVRVHLYLLNTMSDVQRMADDRSVGGFYSASAQEAHAFMPMKITYAVQGFSAEDILLHEYTHHALLGGTTSYTPRWASEGLAEMFETARLGDDGSVTIGAASAREWDIKALHRWTVEEMLRKDTIKVPASEVIERYSRGWALCHYLWMSGKRPGQYVEFIRLLNETGDQVRSAQQAFGDLNKLDSEVNAYLRKSAFNVSKLTADQIKAPTEVTLRRMTAGEAAMIMNRMVSARGVTKEQAQVLFVQSRPIAARFPDDASVQAWFAEIALDAGRIAEADQAADRALADDPKNLSAMVFKGRIAATRAYETRSLTDWRSARSWFLRANRVNPNHPYPFQLYYDSFGAAGEIANENAVTGLYRAVMLMPQDTSLRVRAGMELLRSGDLPGARLILAPVAFNPHGETDNPTMKLIEAIDAGISKDKLLAKAAELKLSQLNSLVPDPEGGASKDNTGDTN
jgi:tetratricopeptide (TPR) repeat protein